jgi:hypothetical protein
MKRSIILALALVLSPTVALAQAAPPPPDTAGAHVPTAQQRAMMQQMRAQGEQLRLQTRSQILAALTPQHRNAVATIAGQLVLSANPNPRAAAQSLDAVLSPAEKQSVLNIAATERANMKTLMQQHMAAVASTLTAAEQAKMQEHMQRMQAWEQSHPRPELNDPGEIVLHTLSNMGGGPGMHGHGV